MNIYKLDDVVKYLKKRGLLRQYKKAKNYLLSDFYKPIPFKKRKPNTSGIYQFHINQQFRTLGYFENKDIFVFKISDHQA